MVIMGEKNVRLFSKRNKKQSGRYSFAAKKKILLSIL